MLLIIAIATLQSSPMNFPSSSEWDHEVMSKNRYRDVVPSMSCQCRAAIFKLVDVYNYFYVDTVSLILIFRCGDSRDTI